MRGLQNAHLAPPEPPVSAGCPEQKLGDVPALRRRDSGQCRPHSHAKQRHGPGSAVLPHGFYRKADAFEPASHPALVVVAACRVARAVIIKAQGGNPCRRKLLGQIAVRGVRVQGLVPERGTEDNSPVPGGGGRGRMIPAEKPPGGRAKVDWLRHGRGVRKKRRGGVCLGKTHHGLVITTVRKEGQDLPLRSVPRSAGGVETPGKESTLRVRNASADWLCSLSEGHFPAGGFHTPGILARLLSRAAKRRRSQRVQRGHGS